MTEQREMGRVTDLCPVVLFFLYIHPHLVFEQIAFIAWAFDKRVRIVFPEGACDRFLMMYLCYWWEIYLWVNFVHPGFFLFGWISYI